jgi:PAS domain S-box-containing protein
MSDPSSVETTLNRGGLCYLFVEHLPLAAAMLDRNFTYLMTSQQWFSELGLHDQTVIGRSHDEIFPQSQKLQESLLACLTIATELTVEESFQRTNGSLGWRQWNLRPWREETGEIGGIILITEDITRRKQAEEAQFKLAAIVESSEDAIISKTLEGIIVSWNAGAEQLFGYHAEEVIGQPGSLLMPIDRLDEEPQILEKLKRGERVHHFETVRQRKDGTRVDLSLTISPVKDATGTIIGSSKIARDISQQKAELRERRRAEEALQNQTNLLQLILDQMSDGVVVVDEQGQFLVFNPAAEIIFGSGAIDARSSEWSQAYGLFLPDQVTPFPEKQLPLIRTLQGEAFNNLEMFVRHAQAPDGIWVRINGRPLKDAKGVLQGGVIVCRDVTELKHSEDDLRRSEAELRHKAQELEQTLQELQQTQSHLIQSEKMSSLGQLVAGVAHEINNPVNFIYGNLKPANDYIQDLLRLLALYQKHYPNPDSAIQKEAEAIDLEFLVQDLPKVLTSMEVGAERIQHIVLALRNFSRMDEADVKEVNIHEGIDSTLMILQNRLKARADHPEIQVDRTYGSLPLVECYAGQLNQVFMNILTNAIDAIEERDQTRTLEEIKQHPSRIEVVTEMSGVDRVQIRIRDNGPGIPPELHSRLCDPFFTTKAIGKGTGLGMSISYQIVTEKHGGSLRCCSTPGQGAEFTIEIPLRAVKSKQ